jgi:2-hydroxychromene-2-carboxylate isomerase
LFDVISPFAYLGLAQLSALPAHVQIEYVPVLFAGLLNHHGFALWRARRMGIAMRMPPAHPFNPLAALRLIIAAGCTRGAIETVFDAVFARGFDVADPKVITQLSVRSGFPMCEQPSMLPP